ncbi:unannotated protein [freshwater metagenome]|uniref:Unannotated protein n=1 Tax=freshwater metagenome TaxID=449393 RepID=A0A6J7CXW4_9ZZZZ
MIAARISLRTIRLPGPVPAIPSSAMPESLAIFRANGLAKIRAESGVPAGTVGLGGVFDSEPLGTSELIGTASDFALTPSAASAAAISMPVSPESPTRAIGEPTSTCAPFWTRRLRRTPSDSASRSTAAFSVSTTASDCPVVKAEPSASSQLANVASTAFAAISGIRRICAIESSLLE